MSEYKFRIGDEVEVVASDQRFSGAHGRVTAIRESGSVYAVHFPQFMATQGFGVGDLELRKAASTEQPAHVSDADKLRILAAVIDAQAPFGTDLADFKRRLQIVLGA